MECRDSDLNQYFPNTSLGCTTFVCGVRAVKSEKEQSISVSMTDA